MPRKHQGEAGANVFLILLAIFLPPLAVIIKTHGDGVTVGVNLLLTILGWIPGVLHAWYIITRRHREGVAIITERPARKSSNRRRHSGVQYYGGSSHGGHGHGHGHSYQRRRSHSSHRQPMTVVPATTRTRSRSRSQTRRYYV